MEEDGRSGLHPRGGTSGQLSTASLDALADAYGVATGYEGAEERWRPAPRESVRAALRVMGVACDSDGEIEASLRGAEEAPWRRLVPSATVLRVSQPHRVTLCLPSRSDVTARVMAEDGDVIPVPQAPEPTGAERTLGSAAQRVEAVLSLPADLPLGYHRLEVAERVTGEEASGHLIVVPDHCPAPSEVSTGVGRTWGWMLQLYALRSERSWGIGDFGDLGELLRWTGDLGGDFAVVNPLHAAAPVRPQEDSPYYPSSRRFANPLYLAVEDVPEVAALEGEEAERVAELARQARARNDTDRIDRDAALDAKSEALALAFSALPPGRRAALDAHRQRAGRALEDFATFCALAEEHGVPFQRWPDGLQDPRSPDVQAFRAARADRVAFHAWLQMLCDEQMAAAQHAGLAHGTRLGTIGDLAVGVDRGGADAWALSGELALGVSVGAPPDAFNQQGQDWQQPPLLPSRLPDTGYAPFRDMMRSVLRHAGGIRIDHVIGLFRLFWIPEGAPARDGTYVRYPADDLLGVLALEAHRAGALVIGEDLGTVERGVRRTLAERSVLTSSVLYFERDDVDPDQPRAAEDYPERAMASVTTHDLPTAAGWWADEEVDLRARLDLFGEDTTEEAERAAKAEERAAMHRLLAGAALVDDEATLERRVAAMHAFLARTPSLLVAVSVGDVIGDRRQPNLPGTVDEYPNWRLPLAEPADGGHRPVTLEHLREHPGASKLAELMRDAHRGR